MLYSILSSKCLQKVIHSFQNNKTTNLSLPDSQSQLKVSTHPHLEPLNHLFPLLVHYQPQMDLTALACTLPNARTSLRLASTVGG